MDRDFESLKKMLFMHKVKIIGETQSIIPELVIDHVPGEKICKNGCMRKDLYKFNPFFIKDVDCGKVGGYKPKIEEARQEAELCNRFKHPLIKITKKIAILILENDRNSCFLVEELIDSYNEDCWHEDLIKQAKQMVLVAKNYVRKGNEEFELKNIGFDEVDNCLKFFDVFPVETENEP